MGSTASHSSDIWDLFASAALHGFIAVPLDMFLHKLIDSHNDELHEAHLKLDKLLKNPLQLARDKLELAGDYPEDSKDRHDCLESARDHFHSASANLDGVDVVKCLLSSSSCCAWRGDKVGSKFFYNRALDAVGREIEKQKKIKDGLKGTMVKTGCTTFGTWAGTAAIAFIGPGAIAIPTALALQGLLGATTLGSGAKHLKTCTKSYECDKIIKELTEFGSAMKSPRRTTWME